jgi:hypothetical protein
MIVYALCRAECHYAECCGAVYYIDFCCERLILVALCKVIFSLFHLKNPAHKIRSAIISNCDIRILQNWFYSKIQMVQKAILHLGTKFATGTKPKTCIGKVNNIWTQKLVC